MILVGPSGCGKSTALRMIAGLEDITEGELRIGGDVVNEHGAEGSRHRDGVPELRALPAHDRAREHGVPAEAGRASTRRRSTRRSRRPRRSSTSTEHLDRKPANLSGGQRQRVAMGRAIVREPKAFLMDEPLSNLDAKLRVQMRTEVSRIQNRLGTTTVYVTHDQTEAMTLGDRVAVMRAGVLQQVGTPAELYDHPVNLFVAGFIGSPAMNFMPVELERRHAKLPIGEVELPERRARARRVARRPALIVGIRPEHFEDATLVGDQRPRRDVHARGSTIVESMGSELYAYFTIEPRASSREELERAGRATPAPTRCPAAATATRSSPASTPASEVEARRARPSSGWTRPSSTSSTSDSGERTCRQRPARRSAAHLAAHQVRERVLVRGAARAAPRAGARSRRRPSRGCAAAGSAG